MQLPFINLLAPHYCCSCGTVGALLCEYCKYDIINEPYEACILCHGLALPGQHKCGLCKTPFTKAWCASDRREGVKELMDRYKFERTKAAYIPLAELLHHTLPVLPTDMVVVPIPTIAPHVRQRGYDQVDMLAKYFAAQRNTACTPLLKRRTNSVQRGASRKQRIDQANKAFTAGSCNGRYLVIDDISTTGATLSAAAQALLDAGAQEVWVAVVACQPLEK